MIRQIFIISTKTNLLITLFKAVIKTRTFKFNVLGCTTLMCNYLLKQLQNYIEGASEIHCLEGMTFLFPSSV